MSTQSQQQTLKMVDSIETPPESSHCSVESEQSSAKTSHSSAPPAFEHLSPSQTQAFVELKALCDQNGEHWYRSETEGDSNPQNEDDDTLLYVAPPLPQRWCLWTWLTKRDPVDTCEHASMTLMRRINSSPPRQLGAKRCNLMIHMTMWK
jgi:hypothetical protein